MNDPKRMPERDLARKSESPGASGPVHESALLRELVEHLRQNRIHLCEDWGRLFHESQLLVEMMREEIFAEATSVYNNYVDVLARSLFEKYQRHLALHRVVLDADEPAVKCTANTPWQSASYTREVV